METGPPRTAEQIIDALAQRRGVVTPVPPYFPLGTAFAAGCIREAYREAVGVLTETAGRYESKPEVVIALRAAIRALEARADER